MSLHAPYRMLAGDKPGLLNDRLTARSGAVDVGGAARMHPPHRTGGRLVRLDVASSRLRTPKCPHLSPRPECSSPEGVEDLAENLAAEVRRSRRPGRERAGSVRDLLELRVGPPRGRALRAAAALASAAPALAGAGMTSRADRILRTSTLRHSLRRTAAVVINGDSRSPSTTRPSAAPLDGHVVTTALWPHGAGHPGSRRLPGSALPRGAGRSPADAHRCGR